MTGKPEPRKSIATSSTERGFSLVELLVVMAIIAILAVSIIGMPRPAIIDVKKAVFNLTADLGYARSEAVRRNTAVLVEFRWDSLGSNNDEDGYVICVDGGGDNLCGTVGDEEIKVVSWDARFKVRFYDIVGVNAPAGPNVEACEGLTCDAGAVNFWPDPADADKDGVRRSGAATDNYISMLTDGSCDANIEIYIYATTAGDGGNTLKTPPIALVISQSGVVQTRRWSAGAWTSK